MSDFSEYLDGYMEENQINSAELSRETGIERTVIYRYRKGSRVPSDEKTVVCMADALRMSVAEKERLIRKYDFLNYGEFMVNSFEYVKNLLKKLKSTNKNLAPLTVKWDAQWRLQMDQRILQICSEDEIVSCISSLFVYALEQMDEGITVCLMMQPVYDSVQKLLQSFFRGTNIKVEQIVCLEQSLAKSYKNLEIFQWVLPLCFEQMNYEVLYYYDFLSHHVNTMSWMPNVLIIGEYVVQFDYEMEQGIVIKDACYKESMKREFNKIKKKSLSFLSGGSNQMNVMESYKEVADGGGEVVFEQPCLGWGISTEIYKEFLYPFPQKDAFMYEMSELNGDWKDMEFLPPENTQKIKSYCKKEAIYEFMESGRVNEFPEGFYRPLSMEMRKKILLRIILLVREGYITYCFMPDEIELPNHMQVYLNGENKKVLMNQVGKEELSQVQVEEPGIYRVFQSFFEYLERKGMFPDREEVLRWLEKVRKEYW